MTVQTCLCILCRWHQYSSPATVIALGAKRGQQTAMKGRNQPHQKMVSVALESRLPPPRELGLCDGVGCLKEVRTPEKSGRQALKNKVSMCGNRNMRGALEIITWACVRGRAGPLRPCRLNMAPSYTAMMQRGEGELLTCPRVLLQIPTCGSPSHTAAPWCRGSPQAAPNCALLARAHLQCNQYLHAWPDMGVIYRSLCLRYMKAV